MRPGRTCVRGRAPGAWAPGTACGPTPAPAPWPPPPRLPSRLSPGGPRAPARRPQRAGWRRSAVSGTTQHHNTTRRDRAQHNTRHVASHGLRRPSAPVTARRDERHHVTSGSSASQQTSARHGTVRRSSAARQHRSPSRTDPDPDPASHHNTNTTRRDAAWRGLSALGCLSCPRGHSLRAGSHGRRARGSGAN